MTERRDKIHREQGSLFDSAVFSDAVSIIDEDGNVRHRARATDPPTSHEGAEHIAKDLTELQRRMLAAYGSGKTDNEAAAVCVSTHGGKPHETYRKRGGEIRQHLLCVAVRVCGYTGASAKVWRAQ